MKQHLLNASGTSKLLSPFTDTHQDWFCSNPVLSPFTCYNHCPIHPALPKTQTYLYLTGWENNLTTNNAFSSQKSEAGFNDQSALPGERHSRWQVHHCSEDVVSPLLEFHVDFFCPTFRHYQSGWRRNPIPCSRWISRIRGKKRKKIILSVPIWARNTVQSRSKLDRLWVNSPALSGRETNSH